MLETKTIEIELKNDGSTPEIIEIGNQYNDSVVKLVFKNTDIFVEGHTCFILIDNGVESGSLPLVNNEFIISTKVTKRYGHVKCQVVVIDEENKELRYNVFILNNVKSLENTDSLPVDENLENYYKKMDDKIHELDEAIENSKQGDSAYQVAVKNGFEGTEEEWLESLNGKQGPQGLPGKDGAPGKDGSDYVITQSDYTEIANIVLASLPDGDEVSY